MATEDRFYRDAPASSWYALVMALKRCVLGLLANRVDPAVWRFVQADALESKIVAVGVLIGTIKNPERFFSKIFRSWNAWEDDGFVVWKAVQELHNRGVARKNKKGMIPDVNQVFICQRLDLREVHHHAIRRVAGLKNDVAGEGDLDCIAMTVQMAALAPVVGDSMACVKFEAAGDLHGNLYRTVVRNYSGFRRAASSLTERQVPLISLDAAIESLASVSGKTKGVPLFTVWHALVCNQKPAGFYVSHVISSIGFLSASRPSVLLPTPERHRSLSLAKLRGLLFCLGRLLE